MDDIYWLTRDSEYVIPFLTSIVEIESQVTCERKSNSLIDELFSQFHYSQFHYESVNQYEQASTV